ncbi:MAG: DUF3634 family protein [Sandaracinaceae bacterium]|nr:MAG: DUF3634 family protein [Sandaracinaceae bacterium]
MLVAMPVIWILVGGLVAALVLVALSRANEIFCVSIRNGRSLVVRGHVPPSVMREIAEIARRAKLQRATVKAVKQGGRPRLVTSGVDEGTTQRLRNAVGAQGFGHLKASQQVAGAGSGVGRSGVGRNLGHWLGIAWLAWLLGGRD